MLLGNWKSYDELEEHLSIEDVNRIYGAMTRKENHGRVFSASLVGVKLDTPEEIEMKERKQKIARRVQARRLGITVEELESQIAAQAATGEAAGDKIKWEVDQA